MSDVSSSTRHAIRATPSGDVSPSPAGAGPLSERRPLPSEDDQPTIISNRTPVPVPGVSDSVYRILQGKILPGDRLGHFELVEYAGGGGMGRVFRSVDTRLGRPVALKVLSPEQAADPETLRRFQNEAQSAARLDHESIVRVFHVGEDRGLPFIVFEFVDGANVRTLVEQRGPLPAAEAVSYAIQIAEALVHAAERQVVHRDIKPSNILILPNGRVKLIDMGLARLQRTGTSVEDLTASGVTLGTFDYISPEQARDPRGADIRSDIYSLGCTLFYMLAGRPPFPQGTVLQKLLQHQGDEPPDIREFRPELHEDAGRLLRKMMAKDPRRRHASPAELVEDLISLAGQVGLEPVGPGRKFYVVPGDLGPSFIHKHLPWVVPTAALICIVAMLHLFWSSSATETGQLPPHSGKATAGSVQQQPAQGVGPASQANRVDPPPPDASANPKPSASVSEPSASASSAGSPPQTPGVQAGPKPDSPAPPAPGEVPSRDLNGQSEFGWPDELLELFEEGGELSAEPVRGGATLAGAAPHEVRAGNGGVPPAGHLTAAVVPAAGSSGPAPGPGALPASRSILVVSDGSGGAANEFRTLVAACSKAADGDAIELRFSGRHEERPVNLANRNLEIRAGTGYRPVVVFRPDSQEIDPVKYPRSMFTVTAGSLKLVDLAIELHVPREVHAEQWSLFETRGGPTLRLERCTLSIRNASDRLGAYHPGVAFFCVEPAPGTEAVVTDPASPPLLPATIDLADCIARGEAVFVAVDPMQPVRLVWVNGLLVTTESFLTAIGGTQMARAAELVDVDLRRLTAVVRGGLCRLVDAGSSLRRPRLQIRCAKSILIGTPLAPLVEQIGNGTLDEFYRQISWSGEGNFYQGFDVYWSIASLDREPRSEPMSFEAWRLYWQSGNEFSPTADQVQFRQLPEVSRPAHAHVPADYALRESTPESPNPAVGSAGVGRDAGFQADRLPPVPPDPGPVTPAPAQPLPPPAPAGAPARLSGRGGQSPFSSAMSLNEMGSSSTKKGTVPSPTARAVPLSPR